MALVSFPPDIFTCPRVVIAACVKLEITEMGVPNGIIFMAIAPLVQKLKLVSQRHRRRKRFIQKSPFFLFFIKECILKMTACDINE